MTDQRIRLVLDNDYNTPEGSDGEPLPETAEVYAENPMYRDGVLIPYAEYLRTYGDPDNWFGYGVTLEERCPCCDQWHEVKTASNYGTDFYIDDDPGERTFTREEAESVDVKHSTDLADYFTMLNDERI